MPANDPIVFKIFRPSEWATFQAAGVWTGSPDDIDDGFIHLSAADQIAGTLEKHFAQDPGLILAAFPSLSLGETLKWEPSRGGALFPHLYGALEVDDMLWQEDLPDEAEARGQDAISALIAHMAGRAG